MTTASANPNLTVVVPAFNEGSNVTPVVREVLERTTASPDIGPYEVLLVNDGSSDDTGAIMDALAKEHPQLRVFHHQTNRGFGAALKTGFTNSRGKAVSFISADGEIPIDNVLRLYREMGDYDLMVSGRERVVGADRKFLTWGVVLAMRVVLGFWHDGSMGIYIVRGDVVRSIPLHSDTGLANLEIVLYCQDRKLKMGKSGITQTRQRLSGQSKTANLTTITLIFWEMWKLRLRIRRERLAAGRK